MQFNSFNFILLFMPITVIIYFLSNRFSLIAGKIVIVMASLVFYAYTDWSMLIMLGLSLAINFIFVKLMENTSKSRILFALFPTLVNIALLLYFKYTNFAIKNVNMIFAKEIPQREIVFPIGISFFTFQQIAYIIAVHKKELPNPNVVDYLAYILYFPKILMGPLMEPIDFIEQFNAISRKKINWDNMACGVKIFCFGLFKKMMIADIFAGGVAWGYANIEAATSMDWILVMLFYTFEIYFDFSGYSDMAVGISLFLNITLPVNFDSPYMALSIRDFWKRWHISLTKFFTKYIYIPLGGSKKGKFFTYLNTLIVFLVSGIWHGANWTFILWGGIHGALMVFDRIIEDVEKKIFEPVRWMVTFMTVNVLWLLFRSDSISQWKEILKKIIFFQDSRISDGLIQVFDLLEMTFLKNMLHLEYFASHVKGFWMILFVFGASGICLIPGNNYHNIRKISPVSIFFAALAFVWGFLCLSRESAFVYFNF